MKIVSILTVLLVVIGNMVFGQENPVKFTVSSNHDTLIFTAKVDKGWHLYAAHLPHPNEGPLATEIIFNASPDFQLKGAIIEGKGIVELDNAFGVDVKYFKDNAVFKQVISRNTTDSFVCSGNGFLYGL